MPVKDADQQHSCTFCEMPVVEVSADGLCVWCRAGFPPSYAAWMMRMKGKDGSRPMLSDRAKTASINKEVD
jgi:hypothetical protein